MKFKKGDLILGVEQDSSVIIGPLLFEFFEKTRKILIGKIVDDETRLPDNLKTLVLKDREICFICLENSKIDWLKLPKNLILKEKKISKTSRSQKKESQDFLKDWDPKYVKEDKENNNNKKISKSPKTRPTLPNDLPNMNGRFSGMVG